MVVGARPAQTPHAQHIPTYPTIFSEQFVLCSDKYLIALSLAALYRPLLAGDILYLTSAMRYCAHSLDSAAAAASFCSSRGSSSYHLGMLWAFSLFSFFHYKATEIILWVLLFLKFVHFNFCNVFFWFFQNFCLEFGFWPFSKFPHCVFLFRFCLFI